MGADLDKLAAEAEADRLSRIYVQITMLARAQRTDFLQAGREAVAKGLVSAADWGMLRKAMGGAVVQRRIQKVALVPVPGKPNTPILPTLCDASPC